MYPDALIVRADAEDERLKLASEMLASGDGVLLLDGGLVLRQAGIGLIAEVIDPAPSARRCQNEYEVMVENASHALAASRLAALLPAQPAHWRVIEVSENGCRIAWRAGR